MSNQVQDDRRILVITIDAHRFATRSRKAATQYQSIGPTQYLGLSGVGRTRRWDKPGEYVTDDGVQVRQLPVRRPWVSPTRTSQIRNLFLSYLPALARMALVVIRTPATTVHVTGVPLTILGVIHRKRFGSQLILDINERPGAVSSKGSLMSVFSHVELLLLKYASRHAAMATVATSSDVDTVSALGFRRVTLVRNAPLENWRAPYVPPEQPRRHDLSLVVIGTIFEGRCYEMLLHALARVQGKRSIRLKIYGQGRPDYLASLEALAKSLGVSDHVEWMGPINSTEVSAAYLSADVGLALYEATDPGNDGLSNKILECVATGRPVVAGDLPENRRFVTDHAVGWLSGVTVDALVATLLEAGQSEDITEMSASCRRHGDTWLNWESEFAEVLASVRTYLPSRR